MRVARTLLFLPIFLINNLAASESCTLIADNTLLTQQGKPVLIGYDQYGYNYQSRAYQGLYLNHERPLLPTQNDLAMLQMRWSERWLSNKDCDHSTMLDRGGDRKDEAPKGWLTYHEKGSYIDIDNNERSYSYFVKIIYIEESFACPSEDVIWDNFCITIENLNTQGDLTLEKARLRIAKPRSPSDS